MEPIIDKILRNNDCRYRLMFMIPMMCHGRRNLRPLKHEKYVYSIISRILFVKSARDRIEVKCSSLQYMLYFEDDENVQWFKNPATFLTQNTYQERSL